MLRLPPKRACAARRGQGPAASPAEEAQHRHPCCRVVESKQAASGQPLKVDVRLVPSLEPSPSLLCVDLTNCVLVKLPPRRTGTLVNTIDLCYKL